MSSIFSKIVRGEIPCYKIAESEKYLAFLDVFPLAKGHTLVIPKKETDYLFDIDDEEFVGLQLFSKKVAKAIEKAVPKKFGIVKILAGHGVGHKVHEEPTVPNFDDGLKGPKLVPGMVLAIEPIISRGDGEVILEDDGYTFTSVDGSNVAQFEHTILITEGKAEIITIE